MDLKVVFLSQDMSFEDGSLTNFVILRTPSGQTLRAVVSDESARLLVEEHVALKTGVPLAPRPAVPAPQAAPPPQAASQQRVDESGAIVFGGDGEEDESEGDASGVWMPSSEQEEAAPEAQQTAPPVWNDPEAQVKSYREKQKAKAAQSKKGGTFNGKHIAKDNMGYPVLPGGQGTDPGEVLGTNPSGTSDEDGVSSI